MVIIFSGTKHSVESKLKMSIAHKGKIISDITRKRIMLNACINKNYGMKGKKMSEHSKRLISINKTGRKLPAFTEEHKRKISIARKGIKFSEEHLRNLSKSHTNYIMPIKQRENISKHHKLNPNRTQFKIGQNAMENHPNWQGGSSFKPYSIQFNNIFKESIRSRDLYICKICHMFENDAKLLYHKRLIVHHIDYNKLNSLPQNCISVCMKCHALTNYNREEWIPHLQSILKLQYNYKYTDNNKIIIELISQGDSE